MNAIASHLKVAADVSGDIAVRAPAYQAANEIERLERDNSAFQKRVKALEMDKARLDWIDDHEKCYSWKFQSQPSGEVYRYTKIFMIRNAIDAAMNKSK